MCSTQTVFSVISDRCLYSGASFFHSFCLFLFFYNINRTTPLLNPPGAYLFLTHLIGKGGGGGVLFEKGVGAYLTLYQFALKS